MKDPARMSSDREDHKRSHREMPLRDGKNTNPVPRGPRRNKRGSPPPPQLDEAFVYTPWLEMIPEREYISAEQRYFIYLVS
jgi:hypothetical protein